MQGKTRALVKSAPVPGATLITTNIPPVGPRDVLIQVAATSICGTDLHIYRWDAWAGSRMQVPRRFGHEVAGHVVEVGDAVSLVQPGDFVSADSHIACGVCYQCRTGRPHICGSLAILGVDVDGCFGDYAVIPESSTWKNPRSLRPEVACVQDPLGNAVYATLAEDVSGKGVAVFGAGATGLFSVGVARACGAGAIFCVDEHDYRLKIASHMGATQTVRADDEDVVATILRATEGIGVDVVLEMSGSPVAIRQGFQVLAKGGRFTAFGIPSEPIAEFDLANDVIFKGARVLGITGREMFRTWHQMSCLLSSGALDPTPVITHTFPLEEYQAAFDLLLSPEGECGKVVLVP